MLIALRFSWLLSYTPMAIMRAKGRLTTADPPPSPIPTGRGSRSAANQNFIQFLDKSQQIPELTALQPSASGTRHQLPAVVDFRSLSAESFARLLVSAKQFGAFRISNHGISAEELGSVVREAESVSRNDGVIGKRFIERVGNREDIKWRAQVSNDKRYRDLCSNMEKVARKVQAIAEQLSQVFNGNAEKQFEKIGSEMGNVKLLRYNHQDHSMEQNPSNDFLQNEINNGSHIHMRESDDDHALRLHLPLEHSQFNVRSEGGSALLFDAGPETLVVTVGKQLEGFKCVSGEMIFVPDSRSQASFSIQLKVPLVSNSRKICKTVSIADQILIAVILYVLYTFVVSTYTHIITS